MADEPNSSSTDRLVYRNCLGCKELYVERTDDYKGMDLTEREYCRLCRGDRVKAARLKDEGLPKFRKL